MTTIGKFISLIFLILSFIIVSTQCDLSNLETDEEEVVTINLLIPPGVNFEGKIWEIVFMTDISVMSPENFDYYSTGICEAGAIIEITFNDVAPNTYYLFAVIYAVDKDPKGPRPEDYFGVYGVINLEDFDLNTLEASATVPETGSITFGITMSLMGDGWDDGGGDEDPPNRLSGNLLLPDAAEGKEFSVYLDTDWEHENGSVADTYGICETGTTIQYEIETIPTGVFNLYAVVHVVGIPGSPPVPGDYYGHVETLLIPLTGEITQDVQLTVFSN